MGIALLSLLAACASNDALDGGKRLMAQGRLEEGLLELDRTAKAHPDNKEYQAYYLKQKGAVISRLLFAAEEARLAENWDLAEAVFRRVWQMDASNERAQAGIKAVEADRRHQTELLEAVRFMEQGRLNEAQAAARRVLAERPNHQEAKELLRAIAEKQLAARTSRSTLQSSLSKPINLQFRDANLRSVFDVISRVAAINFIFDRDVRPDLKASIYVKDTRIEEALDSLLASNQLARKVLNENTILIYPNIPVKQKDYQEQMVKTFYLANADVKQVMNLVKQVVKSKDVYIDEKLNLLVVQDTPESVRLIERLLATVDLPEPEVKLEVEVLEVSHSNLRNLGISPPTEIGLSVVGKAVTPTTTDTDTGTVYQGATTFDPLTLNNLMNLNSKSVQVTSLSAAIRFGMENGDTRLLANPSIRVKNKEKAKVHIGERVPVITSTVPASGTSNFLPETVNYLDVGIKLEVEPLVQLTNDVVMKVNLEVSSLGQKTVTKNGSEVYRVGTRNTNTTLRLRDGETQILAGLITNEERNSVLGVAGLGEIPVLGRLFSSKSGSRGNTEIILMITPRVVRGLARPDPLLTESISAGQIGGLGGGVRGVGAMPVPAEIDMEADAEPEEEPVKPRIVPAPGVEPGETPPVGGPQAGVPGPQGEEGDPAMARRGGFSRPERFMRPR